MRFAARWVSVRNDRKVRRLALVGAVLGAALLLASAAPVSFGAVSVAAALIVVSLLTMSWMLPPRLSRKFGPLVTAALLVSAGAMFGLMLAGLGGSCANVPAAVCRAEVGAWMVVGVIVFVFGGLLRLLFRVQARVLSGMTASLRRLFRKGDGRRVSDGSSNSGAETRRHGRTIGSQRRARRKSAKDSRRRNRR